MMTIFLPLSAPFTAKLQFSARYPNLSLPSAVKLTCC